MRGGEAASCSAADGACTWGTGKEDEEFLAAHPGDEVARPHALAQDLGACRQRAVTHGVTVSVVHPFEMVQIAHDRRERFPGALGMRYEAPEDVLA